MSRIVPTLLLGLLGGVGAHFGWLYLQQPRATDGLDAQLAWIQHDLNLSPQQYARIKEIHEKSSPHLLALAAQVSRMREEFDAFEKQRQTVGEIDFLEFARFVEERRRIDRECLQSTRELVDASADVMNPDQRKRYLTYLSAANPPLFPN